MNILDLIRRQADLQPEHIALISTDSGDRITYAELVSRATAVAGWLQAQGCGVHDRCGLKCAEGLEFLTNALGVLSAGMAVAPMSATLSSGETDRIIGAAALHWLLTSHQKLVRYPFAGFVDDDQDQAYRATDPAYIRFTSGTTGQRKGVLLGHPTILDRLEAADAVLNISPNDRVWFRLPMADHFVVSVLLYLSRGATIVVSKNDDADVLSRLASEFRPTVIYGSPESYAALIEALAADLPSVRLAISTTTLLSPKVQNAFQSRFGKPLNAALGIIEVGLLTLNQRQDKPDSVGAAMPAYQIALLAENQETVPLGKAGELYVAGPGLLDAYLAPWRPRRDILSKHGYRTGDFAIMDPEGFLRLVGRSKNRLQVGGFYFFCEEVERVIDSYPGIRESRVFIDPATRLLAAELVSDRLSFQELPDFLKQKLDPRQVPLSFRRVEYLARTANGKLLRY